MFRGPQSYARPIAWAKLVTPLATSINNISGQHDGHLHQVRTGSSDMLSTQDFAHRVWVSLEDIRERLAVLETEARHSRHHLHRLETGLSAHVAGHQTPSAASSASEAGNGASVTFRLSRKVIGGGGLLGGTLGVALGAGKAIGWW